MADTEDEFDDDQHDIYGDFNVVEEEVVEHGDRQHAPPEIEWYHGKMAREDAAHLLQGKPPGSYLVRDNTKNSGECAISFMSTVGVKHFKIIAHEYGDYYISDNRFSSLSELVEHYCNEYLCDDLCLQFPIKPTEKVGFKIRQTVVALYDYEANGPNEISFKKEDKLTVLNADNEHWLWVSLHGSAHAGFVPQTHVQFVGSESGEKEAVAASLLPTSHRREQWLHGRMSRQEAEALLPVPGSFLIRKSPSSPKDYSLSFRGNSAKAQHFRINTLASMDQYECGGRSFNCLEEIVLRYLKEPILENTCLKIPIPPLLIDEDEEGTEELYADVQYSGRASAGAVASSGSSNLPPKPEPIYVETPKPQKKKVATDEAIVKTGYIVKKSKKSKKWKPVFFALFGSKKRFYYFDSETAVKPKGIIDLTTSGIYPLHVSFFGRPNSFQIVVPGGCLYLCTNTEEERQDWMHVLSMYCGATGIALPPVNNNEAMTVRSLSIQVIEAKQFGKISQPYCIVSLNGIKCARTPAKNSKDQSAYWGEEYVFDNLSEGVSSFSVELFNRNKRKDQVQGMLTVRLAELSAEKELDSWMALVSDAVSNASVRVKARFMPEKILPLRDYLDFQKLILDRKLIAAKIVAEMGRGHMNTVARNFLNVWKACGDEQKMLMALNDDVVKNEDSVATLFRGNSLATKGMDQYMKMVAIPFLHSTIGAAVRQLFTDKRSCELDPSRGGKSENLKTLLSHAGELCTCIFGAVDKCPKELRNVLSALRKSVMARWKDHPTAQYTSISAFLFLRLFCPAIMNPKLFNMMPDHPTETTSRNLTLVAKVVINLANMSEFGQKEPYMCVCNEFITAQKENMKTFLTQVCVVGGASTTLKKDHSYGRDLANLYRHASSNAEKLDELCAEDKSGHGKKLKAAIAKIKKKLDALS